MKYSKLILFFLLIIFGFFTSVNSYFLGLKSFNNSISNILQIQESYNLDIPIVSFIFDDLDDNSLYILQNLSEYLGNYKIYHITLSPRNYSAQQVLDGIFDSEYRQFFQTIKEYDLKVIFRTMHEMNGGRYPRGSNPDSFKNAWIHVRELSREEGLNQSNILFDMSVNHRDMPTKGTPSQSATLITCDQNSKYKTITNKIFIKTGYRTETITKKVPLSQTSLEKLLNKPIKYKTVTETRTVAYPIYDTTTEKVQDCYTFEDYYPGDEYVDIMGVTFYNRGKATYSRQWYSPDRILNDPARDTLNRLKKMKKPIIIDEVGTTAVRYVGAYNQAKSQISYLNDYDNKNSRLISLKDFLINNPFIRGVVYFNVDYTNGLSNWVGGEADWAVINIDNGKFYEGIFDLYNNQSFGSNLFSLFGDEYQFQSDLILGDNTGTNLGDDSKQKIRKIALLMYDYLGKDTSLQKIDTILSMSSDENLNSLLNSIKDELEGI